MTTLFIPSWSLERRRELRQNMTLPERLFWNSVRASQLKIKFRRQVGIGPYIADFYSSKYRLVVELDGESHHDEAAMIYDGQRDMYMKGVDIHVLRFTNEEVMTNCDGVLERILAVTVSHRLIEPYVQPPPNPLLGTGGGATRLRLNPLQKGSIPPFTIITFSGILPPHFTFPCSSSKTHALVAQW